MDKFGFINQQTILKKGTSNPSSPPTSNNALIDNTNELLLDDANEQLLSDDA